MMNHLMNGFADELIKAARVGKAIAKKFRDVDWENAALLGIPAAGVAATAGLIAGSVHGKRSVPGERMKMPKLTDEQRRIAYERGRRQQLQMWQHAIEQRKAELKKKQGQSKQASARRKAALLGLGLGLPITAGTASYAGGRSLGRGAEERQRAKDPERKRKKIVLMGRELDYFHGAGRRAIDDEMRRRLEAAKRRAGKDSLEA